MAMFKTLPMMATVYGEWMSECSAGEVVVCLFVWR